MMIPVLDTPVVIAAALMGNDVRLTHISLVENDVRLTHISLVENDVRLTHISLVAFQPRAYKMNSPFLMWNPVNVLGL